MLTLLKFWILLGLLNFTLNYLWVMKSKLGFSGGYAGKVLDFLMDKLKPWTC